MEHKPKFTMYPDALPEIDLHGFKFYVDVINGLIQSKDNPGVCVEFGDMKNLGNRYSFEFAHPGLPELSGRKIIIAQMRDLDPERMRQKFSLDPKAELPATDNDFRMNEGVVERRLKGLLPRIMICGKEYIVDVRLGELRSFVPFPEPYLPKFIYFEDLLTAPSDRAFQFLYHPTRHELMEPDMKNKCLPAGAVVVEIPTALRLDPVAVGREFFNDAQRLLKNYPLRENTDARIVSHDYSVFRTLAAAPAKEKAQKVSKTKQNGASKKKGI